jgi:drug/metabolite transporter (DMT)-like permease
MPQTSPDALIGPRILGHAVAVLFGLAGLFAGYESAGHHMPGVMTGVLFVAGVLFPVLAHYSWRHSRAAWAYLCALLGVFGIVTFFGAPKVRDVLGISLATAMVIPLLMLVGVVALTVCREDYRAHT